MPRKIACEADGAHLAGGSPAGSHFGILEVLAVGSCCRVRGQYTSAAGAAVRYEVNLRMQSMTGYGRAQRPLESLVVHCELRTVNHRFLELALRLPEELRELEPQIRQRASAVLQRGKLDLQYRLERAAGDTAEAPLELAPTALVRLAEAMAALDSIRTQAPTALDVLRWPGVLRQRPLDGEALAAAALAALDEALGALREHREREGARLRELLEARLVDVAGQVQLLRARRPQVLQAQRERLTARLAELAVEAEPARLEQELVLLAQRLDIAEELDRLDSHVTEMRRALAGTAPVGRRLDFLLQEFNREANTIASKSQDADSTRAAVELKVLIEQMREQVQNVQ